MLAATFPSHTYTQHGQHVLFYQDTPSARPSPRSWIPVQDPRVSTIEHLGQLQRLPKPEISFNSSQKERRCFNLVAAELC